MRVTWITYTLILILPWLGQSLRKICFTNDHVYLHVSITSVWYFNGHAFGTDKNHKRHRFENVLMRKPINTKNKEDVQKEAKAIQTSQTN